MKRFVIALSALALIASPAFAQTVGQVVAGKDNTSTAHTLATDNTGRLLIVGSGAGGQVFGPDASGVPPTQPPVLTAGKDGTNVRTILTDTSGRLTVVGAETAGSAVVGTGVRVMGSDGTTARDILTDASGRTVTLGSTSNAADAVATSATNVGASAFNYGFNGTTFDRIRNLPAVTTTGIGVQAAGLVGVFNTTAPTLTTGQYGALQSSARGGLAIAGLNVANATTSIGAVNPADAQAGIVGLAGWAQNAVYNGATWDQQRAANAVAATSGLGLAGAGQMTFDGSNWQKSLGDTSGNSFTRPSKAATYSVTNIFNSTGTGVLYQIQGSATKTIRITSISVQGLATTAINSYVSIRKDSAALSGGVCATNPAVANDSGDAAATAVAKSCTTTATEGTQIGIVQSLVPFFPSLGTATQSFADKAQYGGVNSRSKEIVLHGTSEFLTLLAITPLVATSTVTINIEWQEE